MAFLDHIWFILFFVWGIPLTIYRNKFRKMVYQTESWLINIKPVFGRELRALFGNIYPENKSYIRFRNFYRFYLSVYVLLFLAYLLFGNSTQSNMNKIEVGSKIPSFVLPDQNGNSFDIQSVLGKKNLVIYFYPKDETKGCTDQACSFRDQYDDFKDADAEVIGISSDRVESHKKFAEKHNLGFILLSDTDGKVRKEFGVPTNLFGLIPGRVTYVVDKKGIVILKFNSQTDTDKHIKEALAALKTAQ